MFEFLTRLTSLHAALWLLRVLTSRDGRSELHQQFVVYLRELGLYHLAQSSLTDQASASCVAQLLEDADAIALNAAY